MANTLEDIPGFSDAEIAEQLAPWLKEVDREYEEQFQALVKVLEKKEPPADREPSPTQHVKDASGHDHDAAGLFTGPGGSAHSKADRHAQHAQSLRDHAAEIQQIDADHEAAKTSHTAEIERLEAWHEAATEAHGQRQAERERKRDLLDTDVTGDVWQQLHAAKLPLHSLPAGTNYPEGSYDAALTKAIAAQLAAFDAAYGSEGKAFAPLVEAGVPASDLAKLRATAGKGFAKVKATAAKWLDMNARQTEATSQAYELRDTDVPDEPEEPDEEPVAGDYEDGISWTPLMRMQGVCQNR